MPSRPNVCASVAGSARWSASAAVEMSVPKAIPYDTIRCRFRCQLADGRSLDYATRYRPYAYDISANGDPDFNVKSFRTTNVVRLEYKPGSTLFWRGSRRAKTTPRPAASASGATSSPTAYKPSHSS